MSTKEPANRIKIFKNAVIYSVYLLIVWGFYRNLFKLPDEIEEYLVKPIIWLVPLVYFVRQEKGSLSSLGITFKNLFPAIYFSLGLGLLFLGEAVLVNYAKYKGFNFSANIGSSPLIPSLILSLATAISEEVAFRGYIFSRVWKVLKSEYAASISTSIVWVLIHIPITVFIWKLDLGASIGYLLLTFIFGLGSAFVFARTGNILSSILLHVLWEWPIILFR